MGIYPLMLTPTQTLDYFVGLQYRSNFLHSLPSFRSNNGSTGTTSEPSHHHHHHHHHAFPGRHNTARRAHSDSASAAEPGLDHGPGTVRQPQRHPGIQVGRAGHARPAYPGARLLSPGAATAESRQLPGSLAINNASLRKRSTSRLGSFSPLIFSSIILPSHSYLSLAGGVRNPNRISL